MANHGSHFCVTKDLLEIFSRVAGNRNVLKKYSVRLAMNISDRKKSDIFNHLPEDSKARFRRRSFHEPNYNFVGSAHEKIGV